MIVFCFTIDINLCTYWLVSTAAVSSPFLCKISCSLNSCAAISLLFLVVLSAALSRDFNALCLLIDLAHLQSEFLFELLYKLTCLIAPWELLLLILSEPYTSKGRFVILGPALPKDLEPEYFRLVAVDLGWKDYRRGKMLKEYLRKGAAKHAPVNVEVT